mgnify:CR=1 FL=1
MRAHEFQTKTALNEYRRDVTAQSYGDKLIQTLANTRLSHLPTDLVNPSSLAHTAMTPTAYPNKSIRVEIFGQPVIYGPADAAEILQSLKLDIISYILNVIEQRDPTPNKEYTQWMARSWINGAGKTKLEDLNRDDILSAFNVGKRRRLINPEHADINKFKTWDQFENTMHTVYDIDELRGSNDKQERERGNANTVYEDGQVRVVVPNDETAACYYGQGTRWCTASTQGHNFFNTYNKQGNLYILLPKKPQYEGEKYQLHFPSNQFMDETDTPVNVYSLLSDGYPGFLAYLKKTEPRINSLIVFANDETLKPIIDRIAELAGDYLWEHISEYEFGDDYWTEWRTEQAIERGYVDSDGEVDWDRVHEDDALNDYLDFNDELRRSYKNILGELKSTPEQIREAAGEMQSSGDYDALGIEDMDIVFSHMIYENLGKSDNFEIIRWIDNNIMVLHDTTRGPGVAPAWTVKLSSKR